MDLAGTPRGLRTASRRGISDEEEERGEDELDEVYASSQVRHLGLIDVVEHATLGEIRLPGPPLSYSRSGSRPAEAPPTLGQNDSDLAG